MKCDLCGKVLVGDDARSFVHDDVACIVELRRLLSEERAALTAERKRREEAEARLTEARLFLRPFARLADEYDLPNGRRAWTDDDAIYTRHTRAEHGATTITVGHCRDAREALAKMGGQ